MPTFAWTQSEDLMLLALRRSGLSFAQIGRKLGTTRGSVQSRYYRLAGVVFESRAVHKEKQKIARARAASMRAAALAVARGRCVERLLSRIARGMPRGEAIMRANQEGFSFDAIGAALGISRQAAHQAMRAWTAGQ
jgi:biotin operon repressor